MCCVFFRDCSMCKLCEYIYSPNSQEGNIFTNHMPSHPQLPNHHHHHLITKSLALYGRTFFIAFLQKVFKALSDTSSCCSVVSLGFTSSFLTAIAERGCWAINIGPKVTSLQADCKCNKNRVRQTLSFKFNIIDTCSSCMCNTHLRQTTASDCGWSPPH